ncbi:class I SAM-dependent methyltransferase [Acidovorax sp. NCPPB 2350]|nr:class I SAM-dependent methyltransferase [Acidovorax sp. NCPPB 2350]
MKHLMHALEDRLAASPVGLALELPGGQRLGGRDARVVLRFSDVVALASLVRGNLGDVGTAIVEGRVAMEGRIRDLMAVAGTVLRGDPVRESCGWWRSLRHRARSRWRHTRGRDARQIQFHYDLSDRFYALWLDPRRVYSCAYYRDADMALPEAQEAKLDLICRKLRLAPGERFLDIGAGWGGLLLWAAEHYGVEATGITLSRHQHAHATRLIAERGLAGRARMLLCDYRELPATKPRPFDKIASVGMFEHVGRARLPAYFACIRSLLRPGGLLLNHGITAGGVGNTQLGAGMGDFIEKYIFPGGELVHVGAVLRGMAAEGLEMVDTENLRPHYARTLWAWSDALEARLPEAGAILAEEAGAERGARVLRAYRLYLAGSAMGFERGWMALHQMLAIRPDGRIDSGTMPGAQSDYPFQRGYMYAGAAPAA